MSPRSAILAGALLVLLAFGFCLISARLHQRGPADDATADEGAARAALARGDLDRARGLARDVPRDDPGWVDAQLVLGEIASQSGDPRGALEHYRAVPRDGSPGSLAAAAAAAGIEQESGRLSAAIGAYAWVVEQDPANVPARKELADLYAQTEQRWLADVHFRVLVKSPDFDFRQRVWMTDFERRHPEGIAYLKKCAESFPDDPAVNLGLAVESVANADLIAARRSLDVALAGDPELGAAQGLLGELLLDGDDAALRRWHDQLPASVLDDPGIWYVRGLWARRHGEDEIAARCLWEAARQVPMSHRVMHQLGLVMADVDPEIGRVFAERASAIYDLRQHLSDGLNSLGRDESAMRRLVEALLESGREWEAWSWTVFLEDKMPDAPWVRETLRQLSEYPVTDTERILESRNPLELYDLSGYPGFDTFLSRSVPTPLAGDPPRPGVRFLDQATELGIEFTYHQGRIEGLDGVRMQETTGGGIGVLDFDGDGFPDLFLTQGEDWPAGSDTPAPTEGHQDRLFRNRVARFHDVTGDARVPVEGGFGQGCSAGDFNNDGFVDLYVANIGVNQLLINQGDGTFYDATPESGLATNTWTSSCLIADLNADGNPDLFDVNYVHGAGVFRIVCEEHDCNPSHFPDAADDLHLSRGDGGLETIGLGDVERGGGPGLAVVAFRIDLPAPGSAPEDAVAGASRTGLFERHPGRLCLFIANDRVPNFFLTNAPADNAANIRFRELAFLNGLAVNDQGDPTACMGVASGDANGDGLLDLFVTNYRSEANNLYVQHSGGCFSDAIAATGLLAPGLPCVGWGTQFLDADNKGRCDLVVANGHVGDFGTEGVEYHMPSQFFYNRGNCRFEELFPEAVGPFFERKMLGRSLATLDWNRDGQTDFALSPIASPFALLTNRTVGAGNFLTVRLHAVSTARDAIGAVVTVTTGAGEVRQQLTGGDGYQATNERVLRIGLGGEETVTRIVIDWPGGLRETIEDVPANSLIEVVEGRGRTIQSAR